MKSFTLKWAFALALFLISLNASAVTFFVTNTNDAGAGSLRQAIIDANASTLSPIVIDATGITGIINLSTALPTISKSLIIEGPLTNNLTVRRNAGTFRIFQIAAGNTVTINHLIIRDGNLAGNGAGIDNAGTLTLNYCTITNNNSGASNYGGAVNNTGTLTANHCTFSSNNAQFGGAVMNLQGTATLNNCTLSGNTSTGAGGGFYNYNGPATLTNCTISGNSGNNGGGLQNEDDPAIAGIQAVLTMNNCTVASNAATVTSGGGINNITNGSPPSYNRGTVFFNRGIIVGNTATAAAAAPSSGVAAPDFEGQMNSTSGYNVIGSTLGITFLGTTTGNVTGVTLAATLAALASNGGFTQTRALVAGSAAINLVPSGAPSADQRNYGRVGNADAGAFEFNATALPPVVPAVTIAATSATTVCQGVGIDFTASPTNGGASPTFEWYAISGTTTISVGSGNPTTINTSILAPGVYTIRALMISNIVPITDPMYAFSNDISITILPAPVFTLTSSDADNSICQGEVVTFTATAGHTNYQFFLNGVSVQNGASNTYTNPALTDGASVHVVVTGSNGCTATSAPIVTAVRPVNSTLTVTANPICAGASVTFTVDAGNTNPVGTLYQFFVNGVSVGPASTTKTYTTSALTNGNTVYALVTLPTITPAPVVSTFTNSTAITIPSSGNASLYPWPITVSGLTGTVTDVDVRFTNLAHTWRGDIDMALVGPTGVAITVMSNIGGSGRFNTANTITFSTGSPAVPGTGNITGTQTYSPTADATVDNYPAPGPGAVNPPANLALYNGVNPNGVWNMFIVDDAAPDGGSCASWSLIITTQPPTIPSCTVQSNTITMTVNPTVTPSVSVSASATTVCAGTNVTFTATPTNGGATPTYQWFVNGIAVTGTGSGNTYSSATLNNGDQVTVVLTTSAPCPTVATATSSPVTMTVNPVLATSVSLSASATTICAGTNVTFTATPTNGGASPTYQWFVNGNPVAGTGNTYSSATLNNGDQVTVSMTSSAICPSPATATSTPVTMTVNPILTPSVTVNPSATTTCSGGSITFTAVPTNGGTTPTYQWFLNGNPIAGATSSTYTTSTINDGDQFSVQMTSTAVCPSVTVVTSAPVTISIVTSVTPSVSISASATTICAGTSVTFTATPTNGGTTPTYQWLLNGNPIAGETGSTYTSTGITHGSNISVVMTSNASCLSTTTATSNVINMTVNPVLTPSVSVSPTATTICAGTSVTFTATPTNGGTPTYQWYLNGTALTGETGSTYTNSALVNGDVVHVEMTSNATCASPTTVSSATVTMTVNAYPIINFPPFTASVCTNDPIITLSATPAGGTYSGPGVSGDQFDPASAGTGTHTITYSVTVAGCTSTQSQTVTVTNCFTATLPPVSAPAYLIVTGLDINRMELRFPDAMSDEEGYEIYRSYDGQTFAYHTTTLPYVTAQIVWIDSINVEPDKAYFYIVRAKKGSRRSGFTNSAYDYSYPLPPVLVSKTDACVYGSGSITVTAPHLSQNFHWYREGMQTPYKNSDGNTYTNATFITPQINAATVYYVASKGFKYESKTRLAVTIGVKQRPIAHIMEANRFTVECSSARTLVAEAVAGASYAWYRNDVLIAESTSNEFTATQNGIYRVKVIANGCDAVSDWIDLKLNFKPLARVFEGNSVVYCQNGVLTAYPVDGGSYRWIKDGSVVGTTRELLINASGTYELIVTQYGCDSEPFRVSALVNSFPPVVNLTASQESFCPGETVTLTAVSVSGVSYEWLRNGRTFRVTATNTVDVTLGGNYAVRLVYNDFCAKSSSEITITRNTVPVVGITNDGMIRLNVPAGVSISTVQWLLDGVEQPSLAGKTEFTPTKSGKYSARIMFSNGCGTETGVVFVVLGTQEEEESKPAVGLFIYPNPASDKLFVSTDYRGEINFAVFDALGRTIISRNGVKAENNLVSIETKDLPAGLYTLTVNIDGKPTTMKFVKE